MNSIILAVTLLFISTSAWSANVCKQSALDTRLNVNLSTQENQAAQNKTFQIKSCNNNIYTAFEIGSVPGTKLVMQIKPVSREQAQVRFVRQNSNDDLNPTLRGTWIRKTGEIRLLQQSPTQCPPDQVWNPDHGMCMPGPTAPNPGQCKVTGPMQCSTGCEWNSTHGMCMPSVGARTNLNFHVNQFLVTSSGSGPRGRNSVSAPNMWMLEADHQLTSRNTISVNWMGTTDKWSIPKSGYPLLLQTGEADAQGRPYIDAQHPHTSPIMGLTFSDIIQLDDAGKKKLTFFFAPRGEATAGPRAYMHRPSAEISPDAPLGHHLQDVFHIASTVVGTRLKINNTELEASVFSGVEPSPGEVTLDMHKPDSYAFRATHDISDKVSVGGSYARVKAQDRIESGYAEPETEKVLAAWVTTRHLIGSGQLSNSVIVGSKSSVHDGRLNSFLEEFVYELGKNKFFGRVELVQRTPEELNIEITDGRTGAQWVKPITFGYARTIYSSGSTSLDLGSSVTKTYLPKDFRSTYGGNPVQAKAFLKLKFNTSNRWGTRK